MPNDTAPEDDFQTATIRLRAVFQTAAIGLRAALGLSQQSMATFLGLSMGAVRNYEAGTAFPSARAALAYLIAVDALPAHRTIGPILTHTFAGALEHNLGIPLEKLVDLIPVRHGPHPNTGPQYPGPERAV